MAIRQEIHSNINRVGRKIYEDHELNKVSRPRPQKKTLNEAIVETTRLTERQRRVERRAKAHGLKYGVCPGSPTIGCVFKK